MPVECSFEQQLEQVRRAAAGSEAGVFGPASVTWRVNREAAVFLGAGRALLLQLAHPWVASAIAEHSRTLQDPVGRFHRTFDVVFSLVFGTLDQALESARRLHARHAAITGVLPEAAGPFPQGSSYRANELDALRWVHATLVDTALMAHDLVMPTLSRGERERFYLESKLFAALFGIPADTLPPGWNGFAAYVESMLGSDVLTVSSDARRIADRLLSGTGTGLITPGWYRAVTAMLLPERLRFGFGLPYGNKERRAADGALRWIRRVYPVLPVRLRFVAPYQVAQARLSGRGKPDFAVRALNKLWTGRSIS